MTNKIMLLGSGELGKELVISLKRLGQTVIAVDNYENAPAMQVSDTYEVIDMLNADDLEKIVSKHMPDYIVPEVESIRTEKLYDFEKNGICVIPSAKAVNFTMNRKSIRDLAAKELNIRTANYEYASSLEELTEAVNIIGFPCVVKPLMSSSGKGQSTISGPSQVREAWNYSIKGSRGDINEVIVEEFISFDYEITLLTVTQKNNNTLFCPPIGHIQKSGDYQQSWQPAKMNQNVLKDAQEISKKIVEKLSGSGIWGIEFFVKKDVVFFSELSPRPHDTGMVTLAGTQNFSEFELHARAILGLPIKEISLIQNGASSVILSQNNSIDTPTFTGLEKVSQITNTDVRIFGKPSLRVNRRMGVALSYGLEPVEKLIEKAKAVSSQIKFS